MILSSNTSISKVIGLTNLNRFDEYANIRIDLPERFLITGTYNYNNYKYDTTQFINNYPRIALTHQLYSNLSSQLYFERAINNQIVDNIVQNEDIKTNYGGVFNYSKKIPSGRFGIGYNYRLNQVETNHLGTTLTIKNEEYRIEDGKQSLIKNPSVIENTLIIRDITGTIIYQLDVDYVIVKDNIYYQIIRLPSGRIANNSIVYIDYNSLVSGHSKYDVVNTGINANLSLFDGILSLHFNLNDMSYKNIEALNMGVLRTEQLKTLGLSVNYSNILSSCNYTILNSNFAPYKSFDINFSYLADLMDGLSSSIASSVSYLKYNSNSAENLNAHGNIKINYMMSNWTLLNIQCNYRYAKINKLNLSYLHLRAEVKMKFWQTLVSIGLDYYNNRYYSLSANTYGAYLRLERAFGYF
jgi:hypothetical protein